MYASLYNRLLGWLSILLVGTGLSSHNLGNYISLTTGENWTNAAIGVIALFAARRRKRIATSVAMLLGMACLAWGVLGMAGVELPPGLTEPLENLIRTIAGMWGISIASHDVLRWRREQLAS